MMEIGFVVFFGVGFVAGIYATTQLSDWIEGRINQNKKNKGNGKYR